MTDVDAAGGYEAVRNPKRPRHESGCGAGWDAEMCICNTIREAKRAACRHPDHVRLESCLHRHAHG